MALHEQCVGASDEWYTPPRVFRALGVTFDLDVASPGMNVVPWVPARRCFTAGGLERDWDGFVWMNAPFGGRGALAPWLQKFLAHGDGVALVPDRTSAPWWQAYVTRAPRALFVAGKLKFLSPTPGPRKKPSVEHPGLYVGDSPAQGTTLIACGDRGLDALRAAAGAGLGSLWDPA